MLLILLQQGQGGLISLLPFLMVLFIIYFFFIRPQARKQKEQIAWTDQLKKGDRVVTGSGVVGKISKIDSEIITLEVGQKVFIPFVKGAISKDMSDALKGGGES